MPRARAGTHARRRPLRHRQRPRPEDGTTSTTSAFVGGQLLPIGGNVAMPGTAVADLPRDLLTWHDNAHVRWAAFGTDTKLYVYRFDLQELTDITPTGVGPLDPPGALDGYGLGDYGAEAYGTARDAGDIGTAGHLSHHGRPMVAGDVR